MILLRTMDDFDVSKLTFDEAVINKNFGTIILYFTAPKEWVEKEHPKAESAEICVEMPLNRMKPDWAFVMISPTKDGTDYEWTDLDIPESAVEKMIAMYKR